MKQKAKKKRKLYRIKPTKKQIKTVNILAESGGSFGSAMRKGGYSEVSSKSPKKLTDSRGFKQLCEDCGLTDELLLDSLVFDIKHKAKNRKGEIELGAKMKGLLSDKLALVGGDDDDSPISFSWKK